MTMPKTVGATFIVGTKGPSNHRFSGITQWPERIVAKRGYKVVWVILNTTSAPITVKLGKYRLVNIRGLRNPLSVAPRGLTVTIPPGDSGTISAQIPKNARRGLYYYDIFLNGAIALDPELEIEN